MPGQYRLVQNYVVNSATGKAVYTPPPPGDVPPPMAEMLAWINSPGWSEGLAMQLAEVKQRGERAIHRDILVQEHKLSDRQAIALGHVLEHGVLTIQELEALCEGVNRRTLQRDLKDMVEKGSVR